MGENVQFTTAARMKRADTVYKLMTNYYNLACVDWPMKDRIQNEYHTGTDAANLTDVIYDCRTRIEQKTGLAHEDEDMQALLDGYEQLMELLCKKMYCYGATLEKDMAVQEER